MVKVCSRAEAYFYEAYALAWVRHQLRRYRWIYGGHSETDWYMMGSDAMEAAFCTDVAKVVAGWEALLVRHGFAVVEEKK